MDGAVYPRFFPSEFGILHNDISGLVSPAIDQEQLSQSFSTPEDIIRASAASFHLLEPLRGKGLLHVSARISMGLIWRRLWMEARRGRNGCIKDNTTWAEDTIYWSKNAHSFERDIFKAERVHMRSQSQNLKDQACLCRYPSQKNWRGQSWSYRDSSIGNVDLTRCRVRRPREAVPAHHDLGQLGTSWSFRVHVSSFDGILAKVAKLPYPAVPTRLISSTLPWLEIFTTITPVGLWRVDLACIERSLSSWMTDRVTGHILYLRYLHSSFEALSIAIVATNQIKVHSSRGGASTWRPSRQPRCQSRGEVKLHWTGGAWKMRHRQEDFEL